VSSRSFDVVIVGAGMVGGALACALGGSGLRVAVLERASLSAGMPSRTQLRVSAISAASQRMLERLGAWALLPAQRVSPYERMVVWDAAGSGSIEFDCGDVGTGALGWIVENALIQHALLQRMAEHPDIILISGRSLSELRRREDGVTLLLDDGERLETALVVGADGAGSRVRELAGIAVQRSDYGQLGVVARVASAQAHDRTARQRFLAGGPLAFLPMADGSCSIVWSMPTAEAQRVCELDPAAFALELEQAFESRLGALSVLDGPRAFPLVRQHASRYVGPGVALVGDAAHTIHPLAGQGVNLGFLDAAALADVLLASGRQPARLAGLRRYERWRKGHNLAVMQLMDGLKSLFAVQARPVALARNLGLSLTGRVGPVRNWLIRQAMGLDGDLPSLVAGP
jgi:2-octaprenylphenol hydroxylase